MPTPTEILTRLEAAGRTLDALRALGWTVLPREHAPVIRAAIEARAWTAPHAPAPLPSADDIAAATEAFGWLALIPSARQRRVVTARCLIGAFSGRHLFSWERLAEQLVASVAEVQAWHAAGVAVIAAELAPMLEAAE